MGSPSGGLANQVRGLVKWPEVVGIPSAVLGYISGGKEVLLKNISAQAPAPEILFHWSELVPDNGISLQVPLVILMGNHWSRGLAGVLLVKALNKPTNSPPQP